MASAEVLQTLTTSRGTAANADSDVDAEIRRLTRRSFATGAVAALAGGAGLSWLASRPTDDGIPWPLRKVLRFNELLGATLFDSSRLAPEFPPARAVEPRVNGRVGLHTPPSEANWMVHVVGSTEQHVPLAAIKELPAIEMTTQLKCVEGWSTIVRWKGVRLADFLHKYGGPSRYVGLSTPMDDADAEGQPDPYYVGLDRPSAAHPQTLLCYEMNGRLLTEAHGAPLRLVSSVKYGYKCIKRVSVIELTDQRPADYWSQRGYDWYAGH